MTTTDLSMTDLVSGAGGHATQNGNNRKLETHVHLAAINRTQTSAPGSPAEGDTYIAGTGVSGWTGELDGVASQTFVVGNVIRSIGGGWVGWTPIEGWVATVAGEDIRVVNNGSTWVFLDAYAVATGLAGAGTTQGAATQLGFGVSQVTTSTGAANAVKLPAAEAGAHATIINADSADAVQVFPASGDAINALAGDAAYSLAAGKTSAFRAVNATTWYSILGA
jgi:hypothetical protein